MVANQTRRFKVSGCTYVMCGSPKKVLKLRSVCIMHGEKFKVLVSICHVWIPKEKALKLRSLRIMCGLPKNNF